MSNINMIWLLIIDMIYDKILWSVIWDSIQHTFFDFNLQPNTFTKEIHLLYQIS